MSKRTKIRIGFTVTAACLFLMAGTVVTANADDVVYATADNGTTNLFGTLDLTTGQYTQISTTAPLIAALTTGPGGTLYGASGNLNTNLYTISPAGATTQFGTVTAPPSGLFATFFGLVPLAGGGFLADALTAASNTSPITTTLYNISADGNSMSTVGVMGTTFGSYNSGNLAYGPDGQLYFNCWSAVGTDIPTLYQVNTTTGAATAIGSDLGTGDPLALVTVGNTLYGVDTFAPGTPGIFTINTATGVATAVGTVTGLGSGYTLDTIAPTASVPEPSAIMLLVTGMGCFAGSSWLRRKS